MSQRDEDRFELPLRLLRCVYPHWKIFALGILAMVINAGTEAAIPALLKELLDGSFVKKDPSALHMMPLALIALFLVRGASDYIHTTALSIVANQVVCTAGPEKRFDLVGFDPRGVGRSTPVECLTDSQIDSLLAADGTPDSPAEERQVAEPAAEDPLVFPGPVFHDGDRRIRGDAGLFQLRQPV